MYMGRGGGEPYPHRTPRGTNHCMRPPKDNTKYVHNDSFRRSWFIIQKPKGQNKNRGGGTE